MEQDKKKKEESQGEASLSEMRLPSTPVGRVHMEMREMRKEMDQKAMHANCPRESRCPYSGNPWALLRVERRGSCPFYPKVSLVEERKSMGWKKGRNK